MRTDGGWWLEDNGPCRIVRWEGQAATLVIAVDSATFERCARDPEWMSRAANPVQQAVLDTILADPETLWRAVAAALHRYQDSRVSVVDLEITSIGIALDGRVGVSGQDGDEEHGFGVLMFHGRVLQHGGWQTGSVAPIHDWPRGVPAHGEPLEHNPSFLDDFVSLAAELAADAARASAAAGEPPRDELERAIDGRDLERVHQLLTKRTAKLERRTVRRALVHDLDTMKRLVRMMKSRRLVPDDPALLDDAPTEEARAWLKHTLRL